MNKAPDKPRKALGKGLSALLPTRTTHHAPQESPIQPEPTPGTRVGNIPISQIEPNPLQPRNVFDPGRLQELANSIQANGIIQPLIVRSKGDHFELIAGERRLRAAKLAGSPTDTMYPRLPSSLIDRPCDVPSYPAPGACPNGVSHVVINFGAVESAVSTA